MNILFFFIIILAVLSMTVLGFGRRDKDKYLDTVQTFSIGFIESTNYSVISETIGQVTD